MKRSLLCAWVMLTVAGSLAAAQLVPSPADCSAARKATRNARLPAPDDSTSLYWYTLAACGVDGEAAAAIALGSDAVRRETDSTRIGQFFVLFAARRSGTLFSALAEAAEDEKTSSPLKVEVLRELGWMQMPGVRFDAGGLEVLAKDRCNFTRDMIVASGTAANLPRDNLMQLVSLERKQEDRKSNPPNVRALAHCWRVDLERAVPPSADNVRFKKVCWRNFVITNSNTALIDVSVEVEGTQEHHAFMVQGGRDFAFAVLRDGKVRVTVLGKVIGREDTRKEKCK